MADHGKSLEQLLTLSTEQLDERRGMDDNLSAVREVEHFSYFARRKHADQAGESLAAQGFRVEIGRRGLKTILIARRDEDVLPATVEATVRAVFATVANTRGDSDGWGGTV
ncbi:MAG: ribonuclease E inhibitor RraB, partial [Cryobacterium sp.]